MGGHGGLNILPQKRWNVYNFDNREKVRKDEEAAAKEEQIKRDDARRRETELRLEKLRQARGVSSSAAAAAGGGSGSIDGEKPKKLDANHMNLFEGIRIFDPVAIPVEDSERGRAHKRIRKEAEKAAKEAAKVVVTAEDEKYKLGYGVAGKGVKLPWYMERKQEGDAEEESEVPSETRGEEKRRKKTVEELREERLKRERVEKERERALMFEKGRRRGSGYAGRTGYPGRC